MSQRVRLKKYILKNGVSCAYCGIELSSANISVDHVVPLSVREINHIGNYIGCCRKCNSNKSSKSLEEFIIEDLDRLIYLRKYIKSMEDVEFQPTGEKEKVNYIEYLMKNYKILRSRRYTEDVI